MKLCGCGGFLARIAIGAYECSSCNSSTTFLDRKRWRRKVTCVKCGQDKDCKYWGVYDYNEQKYKCRVCGYQFTTHEHKPIKKFDDAKKVQALKLRSQGFSYREIEKQIGVSYSLVHRWVKADESKDI